MEIIFKKETDAKNIVVSPRPVWKCLSCPDYGKTPACPPHVPHWKEARDWIGSYKKAFIIKFKLGNVEEFRQEKREVLKYLLQMEKDLFYKFPYAHAIFPGSCNLCDECSLKTITECHKPSSVRPSANALGIEIGKLVAIDFNENVLYGFMLLD